MGHHDRRIDIGCGLGLMVLSAAVVWAVIAALASLI